MENIVITGMGFVTPLGCESHQVLESVLCAETAIRKKQIPTLSGSEVSVWNASVDEFDATKYVPKKKLRRMDNVNKFAINACGDALFDAGITDDLKQNCGVLVGTGFSGLSSVAKHNQKLHADGIEALSPIHFPTTVYNATAGMVAIEHQLSAVNSTITGMDQCSEYALLYAMLLLRQGQADRVVVIGADELSDPQQIGLRNLGLLSRDGNHAAFSNKNDGLIMSEGAVAIVLEKESLARQRGAKMYARITGFGQFNASDSQFSYSESTQGARIAVDQALTQAGLASDQIGLVSCSANGSSGLNALESALISELFDAGAVPVRAFNSVMGSYPGVGVGRLALSILALKNSSLEKLGQGLDADFDMQPYLSKSLDAEKASILHLSNGVGGSALAITLEVMS